MFSALHSGAWAYPALEVMRLSGIALLIGTSCAGRTRMPSWCWSCSPP